MACLTIGRGGEDKWLAAVDAHVAQVVQQRVVGGTAVAQGHQFLENKLMSAQTEPEVYTHPLPARAKDRMLWRGWPRLQTQLKATPEAH